MNKLYGTIDIGGTKIMAGITDSEGTILSYDKFPTLELQVSDTMDKIINCLEGQCQEKGLALKELSGIGVVCAGPVDVTKGTIENPYTLPGWDHYPLAQVLSQRSGLPVKLENDVNGALLGEVTLKGLTDKRVLMIAVGTGIGAAFQADGQLYRAGRFHPELGHIVVSGEGERCYCGQQGCFESLWSGTALHKRAKELGYGDFNELYAEQEKGDEKALACIRTIQKELKTAVWNLGIIFKPDAVILGGGIMGSYFQFAKNTLVSDMRDNDDFVPPYEILQADPEHNPALIGAMKLFC